MRPLSRSARVLALMMLGKPSLPAPSSSRRPLTSRPRAPCPGPTTYKVTIVASDEAGNRRTKNVKVEVTNENEDGDHNAVVRCSRRADVPITATLSDKDGIVGVVTWTWTVGSNSPSPKLRGASMKHLYAACDDVGGSDRHVDSSCGATRTRCPRPQRQTIRGKFSPTMMPRLQTAPR